MVSKAVESLGYLSLLSKFLDRYNDVYDCRISMMATTGNRTLVIEFEDLYAFDSNLAASLLADPTLLKEELAPLIFHKLSIRAPEYAEEVDKVNVALRNLPFDTPLRTIGSQHIGKLIMISGIIMRATDVHPYLTKAAFECQMCDELNLIIQNNDHLTAPTECGSCGCRNRRRFELKPENSHFLDAQIVGVQERPEELPSGQLPRTVDIMLFEDLVDTVRPGDRVTVTGVVKLQEPRRTSRMFDFVFEALHIETDSREILDISPDDERIILEISNEPDLQEKMVASFAPNIYGHEEEKESILYQLFGGEAKEEDDIRIRGDINILLLGDPGTAKSQILQTAAKTAPRGLMTTGRGASGVGLTATTERDSNGNFVLKAGALVLADLGLCCVDEMDKMDKDDRAAIHFPMEQQAVHVAKGGIVATLNARTALLAAANPTNGRYNPYQTVTQNINLEVTILSRFDLIFIIRDDSDEEEDLELADHVLNIHQNGRNRNAEVIEPLLLKKYISYAKKNVKPRINDEVRRRLRDFFVEMRGVNRKHGEAAAVSITVRQLESLIRLSEARARMHLRGTVTLEDSEAAIRLMMSSLKQVGIDMATGQHDIDLLYTGKPRSVQMQLSKVLEIITEMTITGDPVNKDDLYRVLEGLGSSHGEVVKLVGVLMRDGTIFSPRPGYYKRTTS